MTARTVAHSKPSTAIETPPTLSRDVKADLLHRPIRRPTFRKPSHRLPKSAERREKLAHAFENMAKLVRLAAPETGLD